MKDPLHDNLIKFIRQAVEAAPKNECELSQFKKKYARKEGGGISSNVQLLNVYRELIEKGEIKENQTLTALLRKRKIRSLAGVAVITVLTKPYYCPGHCTFCPSEKGMPKSYLSNEPGAMRAVLNDFDAARQVKTRLKSLESQGHPVDKIELIVLGGTFAAYPKTYQSNFIRQLYNTLNGAKDRTLALAQKRNETAKHRCVALSLETRADTITPKELQRYRKLGCTKLQIGIQALDDKILKRVKRGETVEQGKQALQLIRDAGFKFSVHMMPNLPGSTPEKDFQMMKQLFEDPAYKPDFLKLYPCTVVPYSELEKEWRKGEYQPYDKKTLSKLLLRMKTVMPEYVRIDRLVRDIPGDSILAGNVVTNLRQLLQEEGELKGNWPCRCIRCREIRTAEVNPKNIVYKEQSFDAAGGKEFFLTYEDKKQDKILSLLRLRFPSQLFTHKKHFIPELEDSAIVREIHTYGFQVGIGERQDKATQHLGLGHQLLEKAEAITKKAGFRRLAVIASIGTREYYRKWGYRLQGTYMLKKYPL